MNRSKRIAPIVELADNKEKQAIQEVGQEQRKLDEARQALNSLLSFRENYSARFQQSINKGLGIRQLHEYRAFLAKIDTAILEQERVVQAGENALQRARLAWDAAHSHAIGMQKVLEKLRGEEEKRDRKREQSEQDERAGRRSPVSKSLLSALI